MQWLLDTCVVSELIRKSPDPAVTQWVAAHADDAAIPVVAVGELQSGIERLAAGRKRNTLQLWFDGMCLRFSGRVLPTDEAVWRAFARLKASLAVIGQPQDDFDLLIAATATVNQLTLVTRNTRHFEDSGVKTFNPWNAL